MKPTKDSVVHFSLGTGISSVTREEDLTLEELGWDGETGDDLREFLEEAFLDWQANFIDAAWWFIDEDIEF